MSEIIIDGDARQNKLLIRCPVWANDILYQIPSRRWVKTARAWGCPVIKQNVSAIRELLKNDKIIATDTALRMLQEYDERAKGAVAVKQGFPSWYEFKTKPRAHQYEALHRGYALSAYALFMDMQTGKSKTAIDLLSAHRMEGHIHGALVASKLTLRNNWAKQFSLHCPIPYSIMLPDSGKPREFERWLATQHDFKVMVVGWESLSAGGMAKMCERFLLSLIKSAVVGDETSYISNHKASRSQEAIKLAHMADYRYALTGTPVSEGPMNLYAQFEFLDPEIIGIGDFYAFRNRYAVMGGYRPTEGPMRGKPTQIVGYQNIDELIELIAPHTFQVLKTEAYDLPPKRYEERHVPMSKEQRKQYDAIKQSGVLTVSGDHEHVISNVLEVSLRLHQVAGGYTVKVSETTRTGKDGETIIKAEYEPVELVPPESNPKMVELMSIVEEFRGKKQGIVWAVYTPEIVAIVKLMRKMGMKTGELYGAIPDHERQQMVDAFEKGELDLIVGNASTGGMGYTMMASEVNIFYSNTFKMVDRLQAEDRAYGDGQIKSGVWIDIMAEKSIDIAVKRALETKQDMITFLKGRIGDVTKLWDGDA